MKAIAAALLMLTGCTAVITPGTSDQGTYYQKSESDRVLARIDSDFRDQGYALNLQIPVVLTDPADLGQPGSDAYCFYENGAPSYIAVRPDLFNEPYDSWSPTEVRGYQVLLHEIGHCAFGRSEENAFVGIPNRWIVLSETTGLGTQVDVKFDSIPTTVMAIPSDRNYMTSSLRRYFIRELLGLDRVRSYADLSRYADVRTLPR